MTTEFVSEKRLQYAESYVMVPCQLEGERYYYMLYSWVNRDWLAYLGRHVGMPHKVSDVQFTHFHGADTEYNGLHAGARWFASVECLGLVLRASVAFERELAPGEMEVPFDAANPKHVGRRMFWDVCNSRPLVDDLVAHWGDNLEIGPIWGGPAQLTFYDAENEELLPFGPVRVHEGVQFSLLLHTRFESPDCLAHVCLNAACADNRAGAPAATTAWVPRFVFPGRDGRATGLTPRIGSCRACVKGSSSGALGQDADVARPTGSACAPASCSAK